MLHFYKEEEAEEEAPSQFHLRLVRCCLLIVLIPFSETFQEALLPPEEERNQVYLFNKFIQHIYSTYLFNILFVMTKKQNVTRVS